MATPEEALRAGADLLVIGRPITGASDPGAAAAAIAAPLRRLSPVRLTRHVRRPVASGPASRRASLCTGVSPPCRGRARWPCQLPSFRVRGAGRRGFVYSAGADDLQGTLIDYVKYSVAFGE